MLAVTPPSLARRSRPWLLCIDLQREFVSPDRPLCATSADTVATVCKAVLKSARRARWPVVHIQTRRSGGLFGEPGGHARPIRGLEPLIREPLYYRTGLSIFSSPDVMAMIKTEPDADFHLIGYAAGGSCLATVFAGFDLGLQMTLVGDAIGVAGHGGARLADLGAITEPLCATVRSRDLIREMEGARADGA